jgi:hypothetical protein
MMEALACHPLGEPNSAIPFQTVNGSDLYFRHYQSPNAALAASANPRCMSYALLPHHHYISNVPRLLEVM